MTPTPTEILQAAATQQTLMSHDPATGEERPYPSHAAQWRKYHGEKMAWLFNPWTGTRRAAGDVGMDVQGLAVLPPDEPMVGASATLSPPAAPVTEYGVYPRNNPR